MWRVKDPLGRVPRHTNTGKTGQQTWTELKQRRVQLMKDKFKGECFLCQAPAESNFHFHHVYYAPDSVRRTGKNGWERQARLYEATEHPERFKLLCSWCHRIVEKSKVHWRSKFIRWARIKQCMTVQ